MSEAKHTPGPWHWNAKGWVYADLPADTYRDCASDPFYGDGHLVAESISRANGPLISAAPDLLAALSKIVANWDSLTDQQVPDEINDDADWEAARAAIAKAEGRS